MKTTAILAVFLISLPAAAGGFEAQLSRGLDVIRAQRRELVVQASHRDGWLERVNGALAHLVEETRPSVVRVVVKGPDGRVVSSGSGFFAAGLVLTNDHVVASARPGSVFIRSAGGGEGAAAVVASNARKDVAFLEPASGARPGLALGDAARLHQGHLVLALGHPRGLPFAVSMGVVSSLGPVLEGMYLRFVQTDAAVNPGNSGGPLMAVDGTVVGTNTVILSDSGGFEGLAFAVPAETLKALLARYRRLGHIRSGWLGVQLSTDAAQGARIAEIVPGSPAAGRLEKGDRLVTLDGRPLPVEPKAAASEVLVSISDRAPGDALAIEVERGGWRVQVMVVLAEFPVDEDVPPEDPS